MEKWAWWFCGSICGHDWPFPNLKIWHGSLAFSESISLDGFELIYLGDPDNLLSDCGAHSYLKKLILTKEITHVSTSLDYLMDRDQLGIPPYLYTPLKFILQIPPRKKTFQACHSFIEYFEMKPTYCMLFSLDFTCSGTRHDDQTYDFESWATSFQAGKVPEGCPRTSLPDDCPHFTFMVYYDPVLCKSRNSLVAHLLMDPSDLDPTRVLPHILASDIPVHSGKDAVDWYELIPRLDEGMAPEELEPTNILASSPYVDPSDWPERRYLLLKELKEQKHRSSLDGLQPPTSQSRVIHFKLSDFTHFFDSSGRPRKRNLSRKENGSNPIVGGQGKYSIKVNHTSEQLQKCNWSDVQHYTCHDVYFNHSSWKEEQELTCNQLKEQFVLQETASSDPSCNHPWIVCAAPHNQHKLGVDSQGQQAPKIRRCKSASLCNNYAGLPVSPGKSRQSFTKIPSVIQLHSKKRKSAKENRSDEPPKLERADQCLSKPKPLTKQDGVQPDVLRRKDGWQSFEDNIRRSPRFKMKQALSLNSSTSNMNKQKNSDDLSENHKKKLREAVALALESEGIALSSPSFKLCGRRLFNVCKAFVNDILGKGSTSALMKKIAAAHVKQVIEFENIKI